MSSLSRPNRTLSLCHAASSRSAAPWTRAACLHLVPVSESVTVDLLHELLLLPSERWASVAASSTSREGTADQLGVLVRALSVRHEALFVRTEVRDRRRFAVVAVG